MTGREGDGGRVVVGVTGRPEDDVTLDAALHEAWLRGTALLVVYALGLQEGQLLADLTSTRPTVVRRAELVAAAAVARVRAVRPAWDGVVVEVTVVSGVAADVLAEASLGSALLVVGAHGPGNGLRPRTGHTAAACAEQPLCPLLVVPPQRPAAPVERIVVGLIPDEVSGAALAWSGREAALAGVPLLVVVAVDEDALTRLGLPADAQESSIRSRLVTLFDAQDADVRPLDPTWLRVERQSPAAALRSTLRRGDLLVLGASVRMHAGQYPAGFPSTSGELVATATSPVVLVPAGAQCRST